eukprot:m.276627 g.276627  ORF g.276627 m.276627 type:complete len:484 (+) comp15713_c2_seq6:38-1489(+)
MSAELETWRWLVTGTGVFLSASLAVGAGIGGGALFVGLFMVVLHYDAHEAVPLSKGTIFGLAIAAYAVNVWKRHPTAGGRPLIDYDTALMLEPMTLLGTIVGVLLNVLLPNWLVLIPLCVLLGVVAYRTLRKGFRMHAQEKAAQSPTQAHEHLLRADEEDQQQVEDGARTAIDQAGVDEMDGTDGEAGQGAIALQSPSGNARGAWQDIQAGDGDTDAAADDVDGGDGAPVSTDPWEWSKKQSTSQLQLRNAIYLKEARLLPYERFIALTLVWVGYFLISFFLYHGEKYLEPCSAGWITLFVAAVPYVMIVTVLCGRAVRRAYEAKVTAGYKMQPGDVQWTTASMIKYPMLAFIAGVAAAMMGIGGGMVKSPIMLSMGLSPQIVTTTSSFMILFTASSSTIQYLILDKIKGDEFLIVLALGFAGALLGQKVINNLVDKYKKQSILLFLLGSLTLVSCIIIVATTLPSADFHDTTLNLDQICGAP